MSIYLGRKTTYNVGAAADAGFFFFLKDSFGFRKSEPHPVAAAGLVFTANWWLVPLHKLPRAKEYLFTAEHTESIDYQVIKLFSPQFGNYCF